MLYFDAVVSVSKSLHLHFEKNSKGKKKKWTDGLKNRFELDQIRNPLEFLFLSFRIL